MRWLALALLTLCTLALATKPQAVVLDYHDDDDLLMIRSARALVEKLEKSGFEIVYRKKPSLADLDTLHAETRLAPLTPVYVLGHGNVLDPKTMQPRKLTRPIPLRQGQAIPEFEYEDADLRHFIVKGHGGTKEAIQTSEILRHLDPQKHLSFVISACHSGKLCTDCQACAGTSCRAEEFSYVPGYDTGIGEHFAELVTRLLTGPVDEFKQFSRGSCTINAGQIAAYFRKFGSYRESASTCEVPYLDYDAQKGLVARAGVDAREQTCQAQIDKARAEAQADPDITYEFRTEYVYGITYQDAQGKRQLMMERADKVFDYARATSEADFPKAIAFLGMTWNWDWPKSCGRDPQQNPCTKCDFYRVNGRVAPLRKVTYLVKRVHDRKAAAPARKLPDNETGGPDYEQTPCFGSLKLRHPACQENLAPYPRPVLKKDHR